MGISRFDQYGSHINGSMCLYSDVEDLIDEHKLELEKCYSEIADKEAIINICARENWEEGGMSAIIDGEDCLIEIKVGSEVYLALEKYFRKGEFE